MLTLCILFPFVKNKSYQYHVIFCHTADMLESVGKSISTCSQGRVRENEN